MNSFIKTTAAASLALLVSSGAAFASDEVEELKRRLDALEKRTEASAEASGENDGAELSFGGLVEVEGAYVDTDGGKSTSDITLATLELGLEAKLNVWLTAYGVLLYEQGENSDNIQVDEAYVRMKGHSSPLFLEAGRLTQAFGSFESGMVSDPMTLELGETKLHASVRAGYEEEGLSGSFSVFKGDVQKAGESEINSMVAALGWSQEDADYRYGLGASWASNMADTDGLQGEGGSASRTTTDFVGGWSVNAMAGYGPVELRGEYLGACRSFRDGENSGRQPSAWSVEAGYRCELPLHLAVRYEGSDDFGTNGERYGATVGWEMAEGAGLALEYQRADNRGVADTDTLTMQLAMEF